MSDRSFQVFMAVAAAVMFVVMSTPLSTGGLSDLASRMLQRSPAATSAASAKVTVAQK
jgi:hypothetical protein